MASDDESGLFALDLDIDTPPSPKVPRDHQSEEAFLEVKNSWIPKVETGNVFYPFTRLHLSEPLHFVVLDNVLRCRLTVSKDCRKPKTPNQEPYETRISEYSSCSRGIIF